VWTWGENTYGQLGNDTILDSSIPVKVTGLTDAIAIAGAAFHCLALKKDSTIMSWGRNTYGNLGNGTTVNSYIPVPVIGLTNVVAIAGGTNYSLALKSNDSLFTFGRNTNGQLGNGTTTDSYTPIAVLSLCPTSIGVEENSNFTFNNILIYPNPAKDNLTIEIYKNATVEIVNLQGQIVKNITLTNYKNDIDIKKLIDGVYLIKITTDKEIIVKKFIKQ